MKKFIVFLLICISAIAALSCSTQNELQETSVNFIKKEIYNRFKEEKPFFVPHLDKDSSYEFVYDYTQDSFKYNLYHYDTSRILSSEEHDDTLHPHTSHDLFFSFEKSNKKTRVIDLEYVKEFHGIKQASDSNTKKKLDAYATIYFDKMLEYVKNDYSFYWYLGSNDKDDYNEQVTTIQYMIDFLQNENISNASIHVLELERQYSIRVDFLNEKKYFSTEFCIYDKDNFNIGILEGIGSFQ